MAAKKFLKHLSLASASLGNMIHIFWFLCRECICLGSECCLVWNIHFRCQMKLNKQKPLKYNKLLSLCTIFSTGRHLHLSAECSHPHTSLRDPVLLETINKDPPNSQTGSRAFFLALWLYHWGLVLWTRTVLLSVGRLGAALPLVAKKRIQNPLTVISRKNSVV